MMQYRYTTDMTALIRVSVYYVEASAMTQNSQEQSAATWDFLQTAWSAQA